MTTIDHVREHLAHIDTRMFAESLIPAEFCNVDYAELNGIQGSIDSDQLNDWDYARFAEAN